MLIESGRHLMIAFATIAVVAISAIFWPIGDGPPELDLRTAGAKLCFANDETLLIGALLEGDRFGDKHVQIASRVTSLQRLSLAESQVTFQGLRFLHALPNLASLDLSRTQIPASSLDVVAALPSLRELRLEECDWVRDDDLTRLIPMKNLESLNLAQTSVTTAIVEHLQQLPRLKSLNLDYCSSIDDKAVADLIRLCQVRRINLSLSGTEITRQGLAELRRAIPGNRVHFRPDTMVGLRELGGRGLFTTDELGEVLGFRRRTDMDGMVWPLLPGDLAILSKVTNVVDLNLDDTNVNDSMLSELKHQPRMLSLRLSSTRVSDEGLKVLEGLPNLTTLSVMDDNLSGEGLVNLRHVPHLVNLRVQTHQGDEILEHLECLTDLESLTIHAPLTDKGMERLSRLSKLRYLSLMGTDVRAKGLGRLANCPDLSELRLERGAVDDTDIEAIAGLKTLKWIAFNQSRVTRAGRDRLKILRPDAAVHRSGELLGIAGASR